MITPFAASWILGIAALYLAVGTAFALPFAFRWSGRLDPVAAHGTIGFRLLIIPGAMLLWPLLLIRLRRSPR
jgi:hypothetical protein